MSQHVLVVDGLEETETVLRAVLEPRGCQVNRIRAYQPEQATPPRMPAPSVIVVHSQGNDYSSTVTNWADVPRVVIGDSSSGESDLPRPFEYRELIGAIERALESSPQRDTCQLRAA